MRGFSVSRSNHIRPFRWFGTTWQQLWQQSQPSATTQGAVERRASSAGEPCLDHARFEWIATTHERGEERHRNL